MVERQFIEDGLAALYDVFHPPEERDDYAFYFKLVMSACSVLDVGCGTGALLRRAREVGHSGRLCGLDPASGMLDPARQRNDIDWVQGDLSLVDWDHEFNLIVMTGHAFQELTEDDEIRVALASIQRALTADGRFVFETRNPLVRGWEAWATAYSGEVRDASGTLVRREHRLKLPVDGEVVHFTTTYSSPVERADGQPRQPALPLSRATGRFPGRRGLSHRAAAGDWDGEAFSDAVPRSSPSRGGKSRRSGERDCFLPSGRSEGTSMAASVSDGILIGFGQLARSLFL